MEAKLPYLDDLKSGYRERKTSALATVAVQALLLVATFASFVLQSSWTMTLLFAFFVASGYGWVKHQELTAKVLTFMMTASTIVILGLIAVFIFLEALPAIRLMGIDLVLPQPGDMWDPQPAGDGEGVFSLVPMMWGTAVTTVVATLVAAPLGIAGAVFISELAPRRVRAVTKPAVETLAGVPSIVYGYIGFVIINSYFADKLSAGIAGSGGNLFAIGLVIGLMALPTVVSVAEDAISTVPNPMKDGSVAMGATDWQTTKSVTIPTAFSGISAAVLLGVGRAMGETMAATVMIAHSQTLPEPIYDVFDSTETLTTLIAGNFGPAVGTEYYLSGLFAAGVVLFITVTGLGIASQLVERRMERKLGGEV